MKRRMHIGFNLKGDKMAGNKRNFFLNYLKGIACFGVVFCHVRLPHYVADGIIQAMFRFAIPLFFVISGYFCDTTDREALDNKMPAKCKHILLISIIGSMYYFVCQMIIALFGDSHGNMTDVWDRLYYMFSSKALFEWIVFNQDPFVNVMWFTFALLYCYLLVWLINRANLWDKVFWVIPVLIGIHMVMGNFAPLFGITISKLYYRNFLLFGLPFVLLGIWIRRNKEMLLRCFPVKLCALGMLAGPILSVCEWFIFGRCELFFGSILFIMGAFIYALHRPEKKKKSVITKIGDQHSLFVYIVHSSVIIVFDRFADMLLQNGRKLIVYVYLKPVLIFLVSVIGSYIFTFILKSLKTVREK